MVSKSSEPVNDIRKIIDRYAITDVFFAIPSAPAASGAGGFRQLP